MQDTSVTTVQPLIDYFSSAYTMEGWMHCSVTK
jgi:hypothetical protein